MGVSSDNLLLHMKDRLLEKDFKYTHKNPYHDKLTEFDDFVLRDLDTETYQGHWNQKVFDREAPLCVEVGCGYGHFMVDYCEKNPDINFVGMDFRFKRSYNLARKLSKIENHNFRYLRARGERVDYMFGEGEVDRLFYFFPDPWPKKRHHKKRLFQEPFIRSVHKVLRPGGTLYVKTDHAGYAEWMDERIQSPLTKELFDIELTTFNLREEFPDHYLSSFQTKFEKIFIKQNIPIKAFVLKAKK
jgi:tRNA (guanine-N7-)-methyltransferase